ncbi:hypothetical protein B005_4246 [Nocardiopsis alba ATCC BAA-2165]|uniref:Uncharacterized protein n=1 Tax=Nocardiopsis alba (strain ATCC BAA-2165 / BE74) TaxID=1205910 RepID=J7LC30_NOCAA|nr:hypothetical protein B005_4246 [Nocardiopsis alba ATCC BAA-2165]
MEASTRPFRPPPGLPGTGPFRTGTPGPPAGTFGPGARSGTALGWSVPLPDDTA